MPVQPNDIIEITKQHFQHYYKAEITDTDAVEMLDNFTDFARLLLKLEKKRKVNPNKLGWTIVKLLKKYT